MSNRKPTYSAFIVIDPKEGSEKKSQWFEIGTVWSHGMATASTW